MLKNSPNLSSVYPDYKTGNAIFTDLQALEVPWKDDNINTTLDIVYFSKSGEKTVSNIISERLNNLGVLSSADRAVIANSIFVMFNEQWTKLFNTLSLTYDPIENYRMTEEESSRHHEIITGSDTGTIGNVATNSRTDTGTISDSGSQSNSDSVYGFNSANAVPSESSSGSNSNTETHNLTFGESVNATETHNLSKSNTDDMSEERELVRSGNIGVTTSQQMIQSERELWRWNFFNVVFRDIDSILCLDVYYYEMEVD